MSIYDDNYLETETLNLKQQLPPPPPAPTEVLLAKVFCVSDCEDLEYLINHFLERLNPRYCYKPELITSLGCKCPCEREKVVLFYRKTLKDGPFRPNGGKDTL